MRDSEFVFDQAGLAHAVELLSRHFDGRADLSLPATLPEQGLGSRVVLDLLAPSVLGSAARLNSPAAFAHMDPPTPWITWATALWNASLNQNLLHPATAPVARAVEEQVVSWLAPYFGMTGGHMTSGSTLANLTALWAARECAGIEEVIASDSSHLSVAKAAHILGMKFRAWPADSSGALRGDSLPDNMSKVALVLTAGTTSTGAIDPLALAGSAAWTHIDAAWAGPLRLSKHSQRLAGIERADSVAISGHKWLFQPKDSALILFRDALKAHQAVSFGGAYLATPNVGVLGSRGAIAMPLLATLLSWGRVGVAARVEHCIELSEQLAEALRTDDRVVLHGQPESGVVVWRPRVAAMFDDISLRLPATTCSVTTLRGERWFRNVAANPMANIAAVVAAIGQALAG